MTHFAISFFIILFYYRHYFAIATNPGEQFYSFTMLAAWLIQQSGTQFDKPEEVIYFITKSITFAFCLNKIFLYSKSTMIRIQPFLE
jgi:hypothetical protein